MPEFFTDAQSALAFVTPQYYNIETTIYETKFPSFDYAALIPVITEGNPWARGTTFMSMDSAGKAEWLNGGAFDMPYADVSRNQYASAFQLAGIGYEWNLEEINTALMEGVNLSDYKARAARRVSEQFLWNVAIGGNTEKNWTGLINASGVTAGDVPANGTGTVTWWAAKTGVQIMSDVNSGITGVYTGSNETELADTLLLPTPVYTDISTRLMDASNSNGLTILQAIQRNNVYTQETGQPLTVRGLRSLTTADPGGDGRAVLYRRDPEVVRFHLPMPHRFLEPYRKSSMVTEVAGIMRTGGTEIRLPSAVRYLDGIYNAH